ncbi:MAG TPA: AAA family ATPase [Candidatus Paceibacterota bacterium]|nr:AAA family ATPase [Verrucomicrobiota bacterium]HQH03240.1 AAA family ATPase [Verrucomicrobiota bacterium]HQJ47927.1 AAA family ATPase [Verrucomicrobiota bacterium]HRY57715.1 AAA family ATPase [Candidatus Paceibacterota bacterium]HRZ68892.1 AAA family ATPase [Candidatus Paceibacterota bacterium]
MNGKFARFTRVEIVKALGIGRGQGFALEELSPRINIIHGPNGSGKSTLLRVMQKLLWPQASEVEPALARATVSGALEITDAQQTREGRVEIEAGHVTSAIDGASGLLPVGRPDLHARYRMPVAELLVDDDRAFAREIHRQAAGGFDLEECAARAGLAAGPTRPQALQRERREAVERVRSARDRQVELDRSRTELETQQEKRRQLEEQESARDDLERALRHLEAEQEEEQKREEREAFDAVVRQLYGGEDKERARLEQAEQDARRALDSHQEKLAEQEDLIADVGITEAGRAADFPALEAALATLRAAEQRAQEDARAMNQDATALAQAAAALFDRAEAVQAGIIDQAVLGEAQALFEQALALRALQRECETERERLELLPAAAESLPEAGVLARGIEALANWLRAPALPADLPAPFPLVKLGVVCVLLAAASLVGAGLVHWGFAAGALVAAAVFGVAAWLSGRDRSRDRQIAARADAAATHRETYAGLSLPDPAPWSVESVRAVLGELIEWQRRRVDQDAMGQARLVHQRRAAQLQQGQEQLAGRCVDFEQRHGIGAGDPDKTWICLRVQRINDWQQATQRHAASRAAAADSDRALALAREACRARLEAAGVTGAGDLPLTFDFASARIDHLRKQRCRWQELHQARQRLEKETAGLTEARDQAAANLAAFWRGLGLAEGGLAGLARLLEARERFAAATRDWELAVARVKQTRRELGKAEELLARGLAQIKSDLKAAAAGREELASLRKEIAKKEAELEQAARGYDVSERLEELAAANAKLLAQEERNAELAVGGALVAWLRDQIRAELEPPVLARARRLLSQFTRGRLTFEVEDPGGGGVQLMAASGGEARRPITDLSSGERVQLLMAVRLAFLEESEERSLPLLLDEVLAACDDERTRNIIAAVIEIARSGRQVFYFTAQNDEVGKWRACLAEAGMAGRVIDLQAVRAGAEASGRPLPPPPPLRPAWPAPDDCSHRQYGERLQVPGVDPWDPNLDQLHIWHVIEDVPLLYRVLSSDIERLGPLERMVQNAGYTELGEARERVFATGAAFRYACRAWRIGRGKPLTREALVDADGVSRVFLDRVCDLSQRVGYDARRLLRELESGGLRNWREQATQELRNYLMREGYLDEAQPLTPDQIREKVREELCQDGLGDLVTPATLDRVIASLPA